MDVFKNFRTLGLLVQSFSGKTIATKNHNGDRIIISTRPAVMDALKRPPVVLSAPPSKKEWSQTEIAEFYKLNPLF